MSLSRRIDRSGNPLPAPVTNDQEYLAAILDELRALTAELVGAPAAAPVEAPAPPEPQEAAPASTDAEEPVVLAEPVVAKPVPTRAPIRDARKRSQRRK